MKSSHSGAAPPAPQVAVRAHRTAGYTLLELLVTLAIAAVLMGITALSLQGWMEKTRAETFVQTLAHDFNTYRARTMATGQSYSVVLTGANTYEIRDAAGARVGPAVTENAVTLNLTRAVRYTFDTRGFMTASTSTNNPTTSTNILATFRRSGQTRTIVVTALGIARGS